MYFDVKCLHLYFLQKKSLYILDVLDVSTAEKKALKVANSRMIKKLVVDTEVECLQKHLVNQLIGFGNVVREWLVVGTVENSQNCNLKIW